MKTIAKGIAWLGSIRLNFALLGLVVICCFIGIFVRQVYVDGFLEYYGGMSPAKRRLLYELGFFDVYHTWYFVSFLIAFGASVFVSCFMRLPGSVAEMKRPGPRTLLQADSGEYKALMETEEAPETIAQIISSTWYDRGLRPKTIKQNGGTYVLVQRNAWNRLAPYFVLAASLVIVGGMFLTTFLGLVGEMELSPGSASSSLTATAVSIDGPRRRQIRLPFEIACIDMRQELIDPQRGLAPNNTVDWLTSIEVRDGARRTPGVVHLNGPFDYRGYRFYQSRYRGDGDARKVTISFLPAQAAAPRVITIERNDSVNLADIGEVSFTQFFADFVVRNGTAATASSEYRNPAAHLRIATAGGRVEEVYARSWMESDGGGRQDKGMPADSVLGGAYRVVLKDYEKSSSAHTLTVDWDPGRVPMYFGFVLLVAAVAAMMCFSHQRVWAFIKPREGGCTVLFSGDSNRQPAELRPRFEALTEAAVGAVRRWSR